MPSASSPIETLLNNWLVRLYQADSSTKASALCCLLKGQVSRALAAGEVDQKRHDELIQEANLIVRDKTISSAS